jgi:hypothetical protein
MINFIDVASRRTATHFIKEKDDDTILRAAENYHAYIETQAGKKLKRIRLDNNYGTKKFRAFAADLNDSKVEARTLAYTQLT